MQYTAYMTKKTPLKNIEIRFWQCSDEVNFVVISWFANERFPHSDLSYADVKNNNALSVLGTGNYVLSDYINTERSLGIVSCRLTDNEL